VFGLFAHFNVLLAPQEVDVNSAAGPVLSVFSGSAELWLATQWDSNQSPVEFPANGEFYREFRGLGDQRGDIGAENLRAAAAFCVFPYTD
jgi:hypothetical protein